MFLQFDLSAPFLNNCIKHTVKQGKEKKRTDMDMDLDIDGESLTHEVKMQNSNRNPKQGYRINTRVVHNVRLGLNYFKVKLDTNERAELAMIASIDRSIEDLNTFTARARLNKHFGTPL